MKIIKRILLVIVGIVALLLITALFVKKEYAVERQITINAPKHDVFNYVKFLKNQENFSVWDTIDPNMKRSYVGTDGTVGFLTAWDSKDPNAGKGEQQITNIIEGERIEYRIHFIEPFEATDNIYMTTTSVTDSSTQVSWGFNGRMSYPMNLMLLFMDMEKMLGDDLQAGLERLKTIMESPEK